jgi:hypothetical protein
MLAPPDPDEDSLHASLAQYRMRHAFQSSSSQARTGPSDQGLENLIRGQARTARANISDQE